MLVEDVVEVDLSTELAVLVLLADVDVVGEVGAGLDVPGSTAALGDAVEDNVAAGSVAVKVDPVSLILNELAA